MQVTHRRPGKGLAAVLMALFAWACSSDSPTTPDPVSVSISPQQTTIGAGETAQFSATVTGTSNTQVNWSASAGSISGSGSTATFTAPTQGGSVTITATSAASPDASATAQVTVTPVQVVVSPAETDLLRGETRTFTATISGTQQTGVSWSASCGTLQGQGESVTFTAPDAPGSCAVTATSDLDSSRSGSGTATTLPDWRITTLSGTVASCTPLACAYTAGLEIANAGSGPTDAEGYTVLRFAEALAGESLSFTGNVPTISGAARILGPAGGMVTLDANTGGAVGRRGMTINGGRVVAERIRVIDGRAAFGGGILVTEQAELILRDAELVGNTATANGGGGLRVSVGSTAHLERVSVLDNHAIGTAAGAGVSVITGSRLTWVDGLIQGNTVEDGWGAGIATSSAEVELTDIEIRDNEVLSGVSGGGGALFQGPGRAELDGVLFVGNRASDGTGGGGLRVLTAGLMTTIRNSRFEANSAQLGGALMVESGPVVIENSQFVGNEGRANTGAIWAGTGAELTLRDVDVDGNVSAGDGGAIGLLPNSVTSLENVRIRDNQAQGNGGGIWTNAATLELEGVEVSGNSAGSNPGNSGGGGYFGVSEVTIRNSRFEDNQSTGTGGGFTVALAGSEVTLADSEVLGNTAGTFGGGISQAGGTDLLVERVLVAGNTAAGGAGGLVAAGAATVRNSTIQGNMNPGGTGGGGILVTSTGDLRLENVTITGNQAVAGAGLRATGPASLNGVTVVGNSATGAGGGILGDVAGAITVENTLLAGNTSGGTPSNCALTGSASITSAGHNLSDGVTCTTHLTLGSDIHDVGAGVAPAAANNGGPTPTHALLTGSPAIDAGNAANCPAQDQRGFGRNGVCDIGAFEFEGIEP